MGARSTKVRTINIRIAIAAAVASAAAMTVLVACEGNDNSGGGGGTFTNDGGGTFDTGTSGDAGCDDECQLRESLTGILLEEPCVTTTNSTCTTMKTSTTRTVGGATGEAYDVVFHVSGVSELKTYTTAADGGFYAAPPATIPTPVDGANIIAFMVSDQTGYLNNGVTVNWCSLLDYTFTMRVTQGATVTLSGDPVDGAQLTNLGIDGGAIAATPHITPPFDGQFVQVDYVSSTTAP